MRTEPDNPYDANAVTVELQTGRAGHISRDNLPHWRPVIVAHERQRRVAVVTAAIIGGGIGDDGDERGYGIWLHADRNAARQQEACDNPAFVRLPQ